MVITKYINDTDSITVNPEYRNLHLYHRYDMGFSHIIVSTNIVSSVIYDKGISDQAKIDQMIADAKKANPDILVVRDSGTIYQVNLYDVLSIPENIPPIFKLENGRAPTHIMCFMKQPDSVALAIISAAQQHDELNTNVVTIDDRKYGKDDES